MDFDIIADRVFFSPDRSEQIKIELGRPEPHDGAAYWCHYRITSSAGSEGKYAVGADSFQALQLALSIIDVRLELMEKAMGATLRFPDGDARVR